MDWLYIILGLILLFVGGEGTLRGAVALAKRFSVSPAIIGLTVIGFGTSAPELVVSVQSALKGQPDIAIGNAVGSNIANVLLILGACGLVAPLACDPRTLRRDGLMMLVAQILFVGLALMGEILLWHGLLMMGALCAFLAWSFYQDRKDIPTADLHEREAEEIETVPGNLFIMAVYLVFGLAGLIGGADLLVYGATEVARAFAVPEAIIGLSIIAVGTSLPELAATLIATFRRHTDVAVANILGSCLFNTLAVLGAAAIVTPLEVSGDIRSIDMWVMLGAVLILMPMLLDGFRVNRRDAAILLGGYVIYISSLLVRLF